MPAPRVRATMFTRQSRRTDLDGHSHSVELHEAASPYRHPRYDRPSAKEKLIHWCHRPLLAGTRRTQTTKLAFDRQGREEVPQRFADFARAVERSEVSAGEGDQSCSQQLRKRSTHVF